MKRMMMLMTAVLSMAVMADIPLPEHPRPDWERAQWMNLNGEWNFEFDKKNDGLKAGWHTAADEKFSKKIVVPFPWGSELSGVKNDADIGWYRKGVKIPEAWNGKRVFLVIGASDHDTACWFDGFKLGEHSGGYTPFEFELTEFVRWGEEQKITLRAWDEPGPKSNGGSHLYGKQGYGNVRGVWQTVYLEARGNEFIDTVHFTPDIDNGTVTADVRLGAPAKESLAFEIRFKSEDRAKPATASFAPGQMSAKLKIALRDVKLWSLDNPYLYEVECSLASSTNALQSDVVSTYFGMRKISVGKMPGTGFPYVTLNGKPVYLQMTLDQSYHPGGFYTFPSDAFMKNEILISKNLALNANRIHIKVEIPRKLYWADKLGLLIMADVPCAWGDASEAMFREHWFCFEGMVKRDFNHPSVFSWVLFNETWGLFSDGRKKEDGSIKHYMPHTQRTVAKTFEKAKMLDPTRLIEDNSPCNNDHVVTDLNTWHAYTTGYNWEKCVSGWCKKTFNGSKANYINGFVQGNEPMMNSECGNVWGYNGSTGDCDWSWDYHMMINAFRRHLQCSGWLYTEHHDVINEWNGYVRFDRTPKYSGISEMTQGMMSMKDLHADVYLPLDTELCREFKAGETWNMPVDASFTTDKYAGKSLRLFCKVNYRDAFGRFHEGKAENVSTFTASAWQNGRIADIPVKLPDETACGVIIFYLTDQNAEENETFARNFACFVTRGAQSEKTRTVSPKAFKRSEWSQKQWDVLDGLKVCGAGKGFFEYEFDNIPSGKSAVFRAEISSKRLNAKDAQNVDKGVLDHNCMLGGGFTDRSRNSNSYPMTSDEKWPGQVKVIVNGVPVKTMNLPDDPADHRGVLSWFSQPRDGLLREAGSYGYLVEAEIPIEILAKGNGKTTVRLETDKGGLAVYGSKFGRFPFDPTLAF